MSYRNFSTNPIVTHGMSGTRVYGIWAGMKTRCSNPNATGYERYGGKGIRVCERWNDFLLFLEDMGHPAEGMSIERNDGFGDYEPGNCRWATTLEQNRNQSDLHYVNFNGRTQCLTAWAEEFGTTYSTVKARLNNNWPLERALTTPVRGHKVYARRAV